MTDDGQRDRWLIVGDGGYSWTTKTMTREQAMKLISASDRAPIAINVDAQDGLIGELAFLISLCENIHDPKLLVGARRALARASWESK